MLLNYSQKLPEQEVPERTSGYEGFKGAAKQSGNIGTGSRIYYSRSFNGVNSKNGKETFAKQKSKCIL